MTLQEWMDALADELDLDVEVDMTAVLDLARDAAKGIHRPAAPLTTYLVGYAAGMRGGSPEVMAECIEVASDLTARSARSADSESSDGSSDS
ncbi:MAG TPA: DUF6457 domain-containing protein [Nocardioidaceae bacterium]|nr:DUF6457 domain-containing protein [Nocardioidaceae bacterium]